MYYNVTELQIAKHTEGLKKFLNARTDKELNLYKFALKQEIQRVRDEMTELSERSRSTSNTDVYILNLSDIKSEISEVQAARAFFE